MAQATFCTAWPLGPLDGLKVLIVDAGVDFRYRPVHSEKCFYVFVFVRAARGRMGM